MCLTTDEIASYDANGYILLERHCGSDTLSARRQASHDIYAIDAPGRVLEADNRLVRSVYGIHNNPPFKHLAHSSNFVSLARQLLRGEVYLYQSKLNAKLALGGERWEWHRDFDFWHCEDGMPEPRALTIALYIDEVSDFNGPLFVIPQSHLEGGNQVIPKVPQPQAGQASVSDWTADVSAKLRHTISKEELCDWVESKGIAKTTGPAGSLLIFHPRIIHASTANISPFDRTLALFTYNATDNAPDRRRLTRPDFLVSRDSTPIGIVSIV